MSVSTSVFGYIHSIETCGTVDGPGIRFIIFTSGCPLRCLYCSNPDCRYLENGKKVSVDELIEEIQKYKSYMNSSGGGVTISGGEALFQPHFVTEIFKRCRALGIHTALDTSGYCELKVAKPVLEFTDLVLLDIKSFDPATYRKITSVELEPTLILARYLSEINKPTWIRFVLVPGLSSDPHNVEGLADFVASLKNIEKVEVLPFHQMGEYKWENLGYDYQLKETEPPTPELIQQTLEIFRSRGIKAI
ncbi:pyruvate formate-lyase-activating protein [Kamptonema animale CS-326]|jgi:pyruvate formate lyase activating enzyme|uniref:pyruvate formate-lyase-activating protein n=1 Tax=Kamptonema animale TaxID=92934 RepID=UPI00232B96DA|nr:pyruvate formate-lyase-activating protein [Kamptonema animale]MDB9510265.1 pyruvate formate-lyase-activating protein [Kamptonema animale CS-326]